MRAVDRENLKLFAFDPPNPTSCVHRFAVGWHYKRIPKSRQARLAFWKFIDGTERHPGKIGVRIAARDRRKEKPDNRNGQGRRYQSVKENPELHKQPASGNRIFVWHLETPNAVCCLKRNTAAQDFALVLTQATQPRL